MVTHGEFVEWAHVHGNRYGTARHVLESITASGSDVLLEVDVQGGNSIRRAFADAVLVFIVPTSLDDLRARLEKRGTDSPAVIEKRLGAALAQTSESEGYDYIVFNDRFEQACADLGAIVRAVRCRRERTWAEVNRRFFTKS